MPFSAPWLIYDVMKPHGTAHHHLKESDKTLNPRWALFASGFAIATVAVLIFIKSYAYFLSGSTAMLGTLADSVVDAAVSLMLFFAVRLSLKPADKQHRFGHGKAEGIATLLQGAFMGGAGLFLIFESFARWVTPTPLAAHNVGIIVAGIAIALSLLVLAVQRFALARAPSLAIEADYAHYKTDIFLNGSVILALIIDQKTGLPWVDPAIGLLIAAYFMITAWRITNASMDMLMDKEMPKSVRQDIKDIVAGFAQVHGMHDLRTRLSGMNIHISFDVELDPDISLKQAHDIVRALDNAILAQYPQAEIIIHMDPKGDTDDPRHSVQGVHH